MFKKVLLLFLLVTLSNLSNGQTGTKIGDKALELSYDNPNGEKMSLSELEG